MSETVYVCSDCNHEHNADHGFCHCGCTYPGRIERQVQVATKEQMPETSLTELDLTQLSVLHRKLNKGLMVSWINRMGAYHNDVRKSYVYYDENMDFVIAMSIPLGGPGAEDGFKALGIKYWSVGV